MSITYTSLVHPSIQISIAGAIRKAVDMKAQNGYAGIAYTKGGIEVFYSKSLGFRFSDKNKKDITKQMLKALKSF